MDLGLEEQEEGVWEGVWAAWSEKNERRCLKKKRGRSKRTGSKGLVQKKRQNARPAAEEREEGATCVRAPPLHLSPLLLPPRLPLARIYTIARGKSGASPRPLLAILRVHLVGLCTFHLSASFEASLSPLQEAAGKRPKDGPRRQLAAASVFFHSAAQCTRLASESGQR